MNCELPDVQDGFRKCRGTKIKLPTSAGSSKKQESSRKTSVSALLTMPKPLTMWISITVESSERDGNTRSPDLPHEKSVCRSGRTGHGTTGHFQIGKEACQGCILSPCLFNLYAEYIMRLSGLDEAQAGINVGGQNINNLRYADEITIMAGSEEELKSYGFFPVVRY